MIGLMIERAARRLISRLTDLRAAKSGLAAIEFALLSPVLIALFFGTVELCSALTCHQKVTSLASTAADLVAQESEVTDADMTNIFAALNSIIYPYPSTGAKITISSIISNGSGGWKVAWSDAQNGTARAVGSSVTVPTGLVTSGDSVIYAEITYAYGSATSTYITGGTLNMTDTFWARPRKVAQISRVSS
jgi:Flp pilus assembly protein TadG